jgi:hypothetical protein
MPCLATPIAYCIQNFLADRGKENNLISRLSIQVAREVTTHSEINLQTRIILYTNRTVNSYHDISQRSLTVILHNYLNANRFSYTSVIMSNPTYSQQSPEIWHYN